MQTRGIERAIVVTLLALGVMGCGPRASTYDECIGLAVRAGLDSAAVAAATAACRAEFPDSAPTDRALTLEEIVNLTGEAGLSFGNWPGLEGTESYYSGSLHNGNAGILVTELEITVTTAAGEDTIIRAYRDTVTIAPGATGEFGFNVMETGDSYRWYISGARGTPAR